MRKKRKKVLTAKITIAVTPETKKYLNGIKAHDKITISELGREAIYARYPESAPKRA